MKLFTFQLYSLLLLYCILCMSILIFSPSLIRADQIVKTENGKTIMLKDNGTWEYVNKNFQLKTTSPAQSTQNTSSSLSKPITFSDDEMSSFAHELNNEGSTYFRNTRWNMDISQVKKSENLQLQKETQQSLEYDYLFRGMQCRVIYTFKKNELVKAMYQLNRKHYNPGSFINDYESLKQFLIQLYGPPGINQDNWVNDQYKSDISKWGFAVSIGFLTRTAIWKTKKSKVVLVMQGENHKAFIHIKYSNRIVD